MKLESNEIKDKKVFKGECEGTPLAISNVLAKQVVLNINEF
jgi:hypothetical protein